MQESFVSRSAGDEKLEEKPEEKKSREASGCARSLGESLEKRDAAAAESSKNECRVLEEDTAAEASLGECCADGELEGLASKEGCEERDARECKDEEDPDKFDVHFFLGLLDECMFLYIAFLCGSQAKSFLLGLGVYFLMELKRVAAAACVGDGHGPVSFSRLEHDDKAVHVCYKRSVWLDSLLTLGCCVAVKMGWVAIW